MRVFVFLAALLVSAACVVVGVAHWSFGAAWVLAGVLLAALSWLALGGSSGAAS